MGWFDEQIKLRKQKDSEMFSDAFVSMAGAVMGTKIAAALNDDKIKTENAIGEILKFYHIKPPELPDNIKNMNEQIEYMTRPYGIMRRAVNLDKGWYRDAIGAMLGKRKDDGSVVTLMPGKFSGYFFIDSATGKKVKLNRKTEGLIDSEAICFYKSMPLKKIGIPELIKFRKETCSMSDIVMFAVASLAVTLVGMLLPKINNILFSEVTTTGSTRLFVSAAIFMICVTLSSLLISAIQYLLMSRISTKMSVSVQAATMARIMSLPADFFKKYSAGELSARSQYINVLCNMITTTAMSVGLTSLFSLVYISQIFVYAPALVLPAVGIILATLLLSVVTTFVQMNINRRQMEASSKKSGMGYALISGVQKIKLSGSEKRAFAKWGTLFSREAELSYNPPMLIKINSVLSMAITLAGTIIMYYSAVKSQVSVADYYAFNTAYGMVSGAFISLAGITHTIAQIKPIMDMAKPVLETVPEISEGKQVVTKLSGSIELNNVSFRYNETMPLIIDNLSLKIRSGQYIAIVGSTGCGKSTLMRLMLGFETPQKGAVYFDGKDLSKMDLKSLRRRIGVVMQNGSLFQGDVFSNITISAPWLTMDEAWEAAELSGIADDIRRMPMGMHTIISEGSGGISGGQKQRMMIARAIAPKPKILMLDEATSALDNITQKKVSESLDSLKCTRIVIAHRLSTIRQCDRIIVLDKGHIIEDGTYDELVEKNGFFAELIARQRLDTKS